MADVEGLDHVVVAADGLAGLELGDRERVGQPPEHEARLVQQLTRAGRAVDRQRLIAFAQGERLEHAGQAEPVVGVEVREEDRVEVGQAAAAHQLALGALTAVEEDAVAAAAQEQPGQAAAGGRHRAGGAAEEDRKVHP